MKDAPVVTLESLRQSLYRKDVLVGSELDMKAELWMVCCAAFKARDAVGADWSEEAMIRSYVKPYAARVRSECGMHDALDAVSEEYRYRVLNPRDPSVLLRSLVRARAGLQERPSDYARVTWEWAEAPLHGDRADEFNVFPDDDVPPPAETSARAEG